MLRGRILVTVLRCLRMLWCKNFQRWQALATGEGTFCFGGACSAVVCGGFWCAEPGSIDPSAVEPAPVQASPSGAATRLLQGASAATPSASASPSILRVLLMLHPDDKKGAQGQIPPVIAVQSFLPLVSSVVAKGNSVVVTLSRVLRWRFPRILTQQAFGIIDPSLLVRIRS